MGNVQLLGYQAVTYDRSLGIVSECLKNLSAQQTFGLPKANTFPTAERFSPVLTKSWKGKTFGYVDLYQQKPICCASTKGY